MNDIVKAILDMETRAESALAGIRREKDKLPARIEAGVENVRKTISREMAGVIKNLHEESEKSTASHILKIQEESDRRLAAVESEFSENKEEVRKILFQEMTRWMP